MNAKQIMKIFRETAYVRMGGSADTPLEEGQSIRVTVTSPAADGVSEPTQSVYVPTEGSGQTRIPFQVTTSGLHTILVEKVNEDGTVVSSSTMHKSFSYTEEYNEFADNETCAEFMASLAERGEGVIIENDNPWAVFENVAQYLHREIDPRLAFLIIALVLFLTDIAVRKFKFKWPHELIRERKAKKAAQAH